jgi:hypothetical protein
MTNNLSNRAKLMIGAATCGSLAAFSLGVHQVQNLASPQLFLLIAAGVLTSRLKIKLPGVMGNMSGNVPIVLLAILRLPLLGSVLVAAAAAVAQSYSPGAKRPTPVQFLFNACTLVNASGVAYWMFHYVNPDQRIASRMLMLVASAGVYFLANTMPVAGIIAITEKSNLLSLWHQVFLWSFPNYVIGAGLAGIVSVFGNTVGWEILLGLTAVLFAVYQCYKVYVDRSQLGTEPLVAAAAAGR